MRMEDGTATLAALERQSTRPGFFTRLSPGAKLLITLCYLVCVASYGRGQLAGLMPFVFYPVLVTAAAGVPARLLRTPLLTALPFCLMAAASSLLFERRVLFWVGRLPVTVGAAIFGSILCKTLLCVWAVSLLAATTPLQKLAAQLLRWGVPRRLVLQLSLTYRYIFLLAGEAGRMQKAYALRGGGKGVDLGRMGPFVGSLLLRCWRRATRVQNAMDCRGYSPARAAQALPGLTLGEWALTAGVCGIFLLLRRTGFSLWLGGLFG